MSLKHIAAQAKQQLDGTSTGKISLRALSPEEMDGEGFANLMKDGKIVGTSFTTTDGVAEIEWDWVGVDPSVGWLRCLCRSREDSIWYFRAAPPTTCLRFVLD